MSNQQPTTTDTDQITVTLPREHMQALAELSSYGCNQLQVELDEHPACYPGEGAIANRQAEINKALVAVQSLYCALAK